MKRRPPHLLPGQTSARRSQLLFESPLDSWHEEVGRGGIFSAEKLAALSVVLMIVFSQISFVVGVAEAASPTFKSSETNGGTFNSGQTLDIAVPAGVVAGDLLVAQVAYNSPGVSSVAAPAGWNVIDVLSHPTEDLTQGLFWREATGSEPTLYSFTLTAEGTGKASGAIANYSDVDVSNPIDAFGGQAGGPSASIVAPSITTTQADTTLIGFFAFRDGGTLTEPAGTVERWDVTSGGGGPAASKTVAEGSDESVASAGPTGTRTATGASSQGSIGHLVALAPAPVSSVVVVNSTGDASDNNTSDGACNTGGTVGSEPECTLRAAIQQANASGVVDTIHFDIPAALVGGAHTINVSATGLPPITSAVVVDGTTDPDFASAPIIVLNGTGTNANVDGLTMGAGSNGSTIRGFVINRFADDGISGTANSITIAGNYVGTDVAGTIDLGNGGDGIQADGDNWTIGGTTATDRNLVSGNTDDGVQLFGDGHVLLGNYIGTSASGSAAIANTDDGVEIASTSSGNTVGGAAVEARNVISGNDGEGVLINITTGNQVLGNYIGVDATGTSDLGNASSGVNVKSGASGNTIGGAAAGAGNVISGNDTFGIWIDDGHANTIQGNRIGTNAAGTGGVGNGTEGVIILNSSADNQVGGINPGEGNRIAYNGSDGVQISSDAGSGNAILGNEIYANTGMGIDIDPNGVNSNDAGDADTGANDRLNYPVITSATEVGSTVTVDFDLDVPNGSYRVEFFTNSAADGSGNGEGEAFVSSVDVAVSGGIPTPAAHTFSGSVGDILTATATEGTAAPFGSTSEFSAAVAVVSGAHVVNSTGDFGDNNPGDGTCYTGANNSEFNNECTLRAAMEEANAGPGVAGIEFDMPATEGGHSGGVWRIRIGSEFPYLSGTTIIDGSTQPGYGIAPLVHLEGIDLSGAEDAFHFLAGADNSSVQALAITSFPDVGVIVNANNVSVLDNHIGVMPDGVTAAGNTDEGIIVSNAATDTIIDGNLIGDNGAAAITLNDTSTGTRITNNLIGTDAGGTVDLGNAQGVWADTTGSAIVGGADPADANVIAFSAWDGIELRNSGPGIAILGNSIYSNGLLGINAVDAGDPVSGVTVNDAGDGDTGPNGLLNTPVINSAVTSGPIVIVSGTWDLPAGYYRFETFISSAADPSGYGEGTTFSGSSSLSHPGGGDQPWGAAFVASQGDVITATTTQCSDASCTSFLATSEFSAAVTVAPPPLTVNSTGDSSDNNLGDGSCDTGGYNSQAATECTLRAAIEEANALGGTDSIAFSIPASETGHSGGVWTISPSAELPPIAEALTIDGTTQPGWATTPVVEVNGQSAGASADGFTITGDNTEIRSLAINRFGDDAFNVDAGASGTVIAGNHIGTDPTGLLDRGNGGSGVDLGTGSGPTLVGGSTVADSNVISGNGNDGIIIWESDGNTVIGNYIGTDITGNAPLPNAADGIALGSTSSSNAIGQPGAGNVLSGNGNDGLESDASGAGNKVQSNMIGLGVDGTTTVANGRYGVVLYNVANNTLIGGGGAGEGNVISGNTSRGVHLDGNDSLATDANVIAGNMIGTNAAGTAPRPNTSGVYVEAGAINTVIGGTTAGARNTISGNTEDGIYVTSAGTDGTIIQGNYIGTNATGDAAIPNGDRGVQIESGATNTTVGGAVAGAGNVISGNTGDGVIVADWLSLGTTGNDVIDNLIGVAADGTSPLSNGANGIHLDPVATTLISGNTIAHNGADGIVLESGTLSGNSIIGNSIHSNSQLGIDIGNNGVTANDAGDGDNGANDLLNFPVITSATEAAGTVTVDFDLDVPAGDYRIEFFDNTAADPSGNGEGETLVGSYDVLGHLGGSVSYGTTFAGASGDIITATATEETAAPFGSTSEFSAAYTVAALYEISGTVFEDIVGDVLDDGVIGDANNPHAAGVDVYLYRDGGNNTLDVTDTLVAGPVATDASGAYSFAGLADGVYFVRVDSLTVSSAQDPTAAVGDIWAVQTYGPAGGVCANGSGSSWENVTAGPCYGGVTGLFSDTASLPLHRARIALAGAAVASVDFGFSFNVVVNTRGGDTADDHGGSNRTVQGSLRQFIQNANAISGPNAMRFVPVEPVDVTSGADGWWQVAVSTALPASTDADTAIDGTAYDLVDGVSLRNANALGPELEISGTAGNGLEINADTNQVRDLVVNGFATGIAVLGGDATIIAGNYIGPDATGAVGEVGNSDEGVLVYGATNTVIGGTAVADRNVISGNRLRGIAIDDWSDGAAYVSDGTEIIGNYIGTNAAGTANLPFDNSPQYQQMGIYILEGRDNVIGTAADGNLLSGNYWYGVYIWGPNATNNKIQGNIVGLNAAASAAVPNGWESTVRGGVYLSNTPGNVIGGIGAGEGNIIASNSHYGVAVQGASAVDNSILSNEIYGNVDLGIALELDGVTANDIDDVDTGANDLLNFPVITSATETGGVVTLVGAWDMPAGWYRIETFTNTVADGSGYGEGESITGSSTLYHDGSGPGAWGAAFAGSVGDIITANATECTDAGCTDFDSTSEFSAAVTVTVPDTTAPVITLVGANPQTVEVGSAYTELGATALDDIDGDISGSIVIDATAVNTSALGSYVVTYNVSDSSGNPATEETRTVDVVDTTVPVLTLTGANPQTIEVGSVYAELGATATDNYDGDISGSIVINSSAVNTTVVGTYVVTYDVADSSGNPASGFRTVNVVDTTVPVITLSGTDPQTLEVMTAYSELGATASDNYDGDITGSIVIDSSAVNMSAVGSYTVTYNVSDSEGNAALQVTRTVDVVDTTIPVITLTGADPQTLEVLAAYSELGATASDNYDGDITGSIVIDAGAVNTALVGSYTVTYDVTDSEGNAAVQVTRTVDVVDTALPVITLTGANPQTLEVGSVYSELGATASDNYDGDITGSIAINSAAVNTAIVGSYTVTYDVTDSEGNAAVQVTRTVDVVDTTLPVITLTGVDPQTLEVMTVYSELGATATDNYDGDLTVSIVIGSSAVNMAAVGSYTVTYDVTDSEGNAAVQVTRTVDVVDTTLPVITLIGANPQTVQVGSPYSELGATASDNYDGDISPSVVIDATAVDNLTVGSYLVTYDVTDSEGNAAVQVTRTVNVVDTTLPVITLTGVNPQVIEVGSPYAELGATASDNYDGDITGSIIIDSSAVATTVVGGYTVTYDVTDSEGNAAVQVTRTVNVVDTTLPVITLTGVNPQVIEVGSPYAELGATASDNYDGDLTGSIVIDTAAVNTAAIGSYVVTYDVTDANGNAATQVTRTVNVVDTTAPVIILVGANPQTIEVGSAYTELGATATDNYDGDLTGSIVTNSAAVNTAVVGSYIVTYDVVDSSGNPAGAIRTVNVVDTTAPVIILVGANPQTIEVGSPYVELGATATDNYDGVLTGSIVTDSSAVNAAVVGSYTVTYNVTDANGNAATQVTRTVDVVDTTAPVIALLGVNPQVIEVGSPYVELGATATDSYDGVLTGSIVTDSSAVNTAVVGSYTVTYNVTDANGNAATQVTRIVDVVDTTAPVIVLLGANPQTIEVGDSYVELGATATDNYDGDISGSILIDSSAVVTAVVGSYVVTYDVADSESNAAIQVTRTVDVVDTTAPVITLVGANPQVIEAGSPYVELGATASDVGDGDVTGWIVTDSSAVNTAAVGSYTVTYDVTDSEGNIATQVTRTVDVVDTTAPVITLVGANSQVLEVLTGYVELGATAADIGDGDISGSIVIDTSGVDMATVGSYVVTYDVTDSQGNVAAQVTRTVDVVDTTAPVITLAGANPQTIEAGSPYVELGATATDNYDGDISGAIVIDAAAVNTAVVGSYAVTYNVADSEGNAATQATRTVDVVDTTAPVITLTGPNPQVVEVGSPYAELGATALDAGDGDLTGSILIDSSAVNTAVVASYTVTYDVTDSQGNAATQATRTVDVVDTTLPVITLVGANPQIIEVGVPYAELGATASDNYDGDISGAIVIDATAVDTATVGSYPVTYNVTDAYSNAAIQVTRTVNIIDTTAPVIVLVGPNPQVIEVGTPYTELGATASDVGDGDLTGSLVIDASAVDTAIVASYNVTYDVTDSQGNPALQVIRTVLVVDTTVPVITLTGTNPQVIEVGSPYIELGATASDNYDGDITGSIVINSVAVNTATVGSYTVTYDVADANGNTATQATRTVNVIDTTAPVITLVGVNPQVIEVGSPYTELGATAFDIGDGDLTGSIVIDSASVNTATVGSYAVTYNVTDSQGNAATQVTRTVDIVDTTVPVITLVGVNPQFIEVGSPYVELGATANDNYDGDISGSIAIDATAVNTALVGSYLVTYDVTDANGNAAAQVTRTVDVVDTTLPVITLLGANPQVIEVGSPYIELGATASDNYDGDITGSIVIDATAVNTAMVGSYSVTYNVTDANGNAATQVTRTVDVVDTTAPVITLLGANPQFIEVGSPYTELGATANDNYDGDITGSIAINATAVNTAIVGSYVVTYDVVDGNGNPAFAIRTVNIVDTTVPVITLAGADPQTIEVGSPYVELGATALDNYDGDITGSIVIDSLAVNTAVVGSYPVTYDVADANGNAAAQVTRTIDVVDTTAPVITLLGPNPQSVGVGSPYVELGATALDNYDGDITGSIVIDSSAVNTAVVGSYPVTYDVTDANGNAAVRVVRTVDVVNVAPTLGFIGNQTIAELTLTTFTATASDPDPTDPLTFSLSGAPAGAVIDPVTGVFTWTPSEAQGPNVTAFDAVVTDGGTPALTDSQTVTITVTEVNLAPTIGPIAPQNVNELTVLAFTVPASDPDIPANTLTFSLSGEPAGAAVDSATGAFSWTPTEAQGPGVYVFDMVVADDGSPSLGDTLPVTVTVAEVNVAPVVTNPGDQLSAEADVVSVFITASDADVPANTVTFSATGLPDGLGINAASGEITGTIDYTANANSPFSTTVTATDNGTPIRSGQTTFTWTVADTNRPPVAVVDTALVAEDTTQVLDVLANDSDPDGDPLTVSAVTTPANGAAVARGSGISYRPDSNYFGPDSFTYTVSDGRGGLTMATVSITVTPVNDVPTLSAPTSLSVDEGTLSMFTVSSSDIEGDAVTYTLSGAPAGATIGASSGTFVWTPAESQGPAVYDFDIVATDHGTPARSTSRSIRIDVAEVNVAPIVVNPGEQVSAENDSVTLMIVATDSDVPAGTMRFAAAGLPPGLSIDSGSGLISGTIPFDAAAGSLYAVTITVTDNGVPQRSTAVNFDWRIRNTNRAPSAMDVTIFAEAGIPTSFVLNGSDPDGDVLTFTIDESPTQGAISGGPRLYDYTPVPAASGSDTFTFIVSDGSLQATGTATVEITPNIVPVGGSDRYTVRRGGGLVVDAPGVLGNDRDPEGEPLTAIIDTYPSHGSLRFEVDGSFVYNNRDEAVEHDGFSYRISDGMRVSEPITVTIVLETNRAPVVVDDAVTLDEDTSVTFYPLANDSDPNDEPVLVSTASDPVNGTLQWSLDGAFRYRPSDDWNGTEVVDYVATDGDLTTSGTITISVVPINDAPTASPMEVTGNSGEVVVVDLRASASDVDGDSLEFLLEPPSTGSVVQLGPGVFEIDLDGVVRDMSPLTFVAADPAGERASSVVTVYVRIPAELVGVPSLVSDDVGSDPTGAAADRPEPPPDGAPLMNGLRLMVGSVLDTFQALRMPTFALLAIVLVSLYLGLSRKFVFASTPTAMPLGGRKHVDIVMAQSSAGVPVRSEAGIHQSVVHRFRPDETGIVTTGARSLVRSEIWVEVETPDGDGWVNAEFVTEQQTNAAFSDDLRPEDMVTAFVEQLYAGGDLLESTGGHDLHVARYGPPIRFAANSLSRLLSGASVYWWWGPSGDTPKHQGTFAETVGESVSTAFRNRDAHELAAQHQVPVEFASMHSLVVGNDGLGEEWRIFFRYEDDEPSIAGLMRDAQPNPAAMHGEMILRSA